MSINPNPENRSLFRLENALIFAVYLVAVVVLTSAAESIVANAVMPTKMLPFQPLNRASFSDTHLQETFSWGYEARNAALLLYFIDFSYGWVRTP